MKQVDELDCKKVDDSKCENNEWTRAVIMEWEGKDRKERKL